MADAGGADIRETVRINGAIPGVISGGGKMLAHTCKILLAIPGLDIDLVNQAAGLSQPLVPYLRTQGFENAGALFISQVQTARVGAKIGLTIRICATIGGAKGQSAKTIKTVMQTIGRAVGVGGAGLCIGAVTSIIVAPDTPKPFLTGSRIGIDRTPGTGLAGFLIACRSTYGGRKACVIAIAQVHTARAGAKVAFTIGTFGTSYQGAKGHAAKAIKTRMQTRFGAIGIGGAGLGREAVATVIVGAETGKPV